MRNIIESKEQAITDEARMRSTDDVAEWLSLADNSNIALLMLYEKPMDHEPSAAGFLLLDKFGLTEEILKGSPHYIGYHSGAECFSSKDELSYSGMIDKMWGSRDDIHYSITAEPLPQIIVNGRNYCKDYQCGIFFAALDVNTGEVADSVIVNTGRYGELKLRHVF